MAYVALYWSVMILGYFIASKVRHMKDKLSFINPIMLTCISLLVFLMGIRMGSNEEVIANLGTIGIQSLIITVILMAGSVIAVTIARKLLGMNKYGLLKGQEELLEAEPKEKTEEKGDSSSNLMTLLIIIFVIIGLAVGYFVVRTQVPDIDAFNDKCSTAMTVGLATLLGVIGFEMGLEGTVLVYLKKAGLRVMVFPIAVLSGTTAAGILISFIFGDLSIKESLAISYGFGWYTFAPVSIANAGYVMASAISFMHNVIRELAGIVLIPFLAKRLGYIEVTSLAGVASMDICLPIVEQATRQDIIVYSFAIGMVDSVSVPLLVSLALSL